MNNNRLPLAARIRPINLDEFLGQEEVVGKGKMLRKAIGSDRLPSMIFWGPPGSGKTTLAFIIAQATHADFVQISATIGGKNELREIVKRAEQNLRLGQKTILFIDEIHRWNKAQQDALLPHVERGTIVLIGATTENPSFEVVGALLSRCLVFVLTKLSREQIAEIIKRAIKDKSRGLGEINIKIGKKEIEMLAGMSNGDARTALNVMEYASSISHNITAEIIREAFQKSHLLYDKDGEEHYNIISALHKSMRGGDANAALYWLARMLEAGEDPLYVARRLIRFASEDIGLANSRALEQAIAAYRACHYIGMPECNVILAQAVVYMAKCQKSNELYTAYQKAQNDVKEYGNLGVPLHLRNAPTKLMKNLGYGKDYKYSPNYDYQENQEYLPPELKNQKYLD
ncbi:AAA family ATPase [Candidatus Kuenenbacteria bacterium CG_4_8_14_3_um_filter_39_15]|uniref:AAA family ATPase n=5 Tax=Candidatus Kueneniibacteriota TaxID=1752740 RepID=A0A2M7IKX4_9BACT|nr:replication-associated recombination protein A [Candidatus Kuenenbacteria bacterium]OIP55842.1 MAG: AAA family ATPase [Candidatus Kuenenbacteria bacterium CG2_30_39_24]PIP29009.1 MAG: AAA family ATPase [Candidatus Kuenenbacteria bacterium CG23_combo_of_CG06-09_8_20_14_all_39_39]PIP75704.1 MAG: AAA family ATPase [Candidatus Kuenenbacteria bacterium CG22_combo_CG10-13_8_21_14_all_39_9]PIW95454.1 MAG: AAA family ATPase [Candidatus Kuenenbacteria bacterium CG_4_8_14_3_um_filter_39_15]PIX92120.1